MPDYYLTFFRNYDAALGRWIGVDPVAESAHSMSSYQYAGNNPIMFNDPLGAEESPQPVNGIPWVHNSSNSEYYYQAWLNSGEGGGGGSGGGGSGGGGSGGGGLTDAQWAFVTTMYNDGPIPANYKLNHTTGVFVSMEDADATVAAIRYENSFNGWGMPGVVGSMADAISAFNSMTTGKKISADGKRSVDDAPPPIISDAYIHLAEVDIVDNANQEGESNGKLFDVSDALDKSLNLTANAVVGSQAFAGVGWKQMVRDVPILKQLGVATGIVGFANHAVNFYKKPNWKDGLEMGGQLGVWGLKIALPESYVIDAVEFGYNNGTMIFDTIWDANHKK